MMLNNILNSGEIIKVPPLQSSGTITLLDIQTEFGGSNPISINEYYRGGGLVPNISINNSIPTSGQISLSDFYGATAADIIPNSVNWADMNLTRNNPAFPLFAFTANTNSQTISGINENITLGVNISLALFDDFYGFNGNIYLQRNVNGAGWFSFSSLQQNGDDQVEGNIGTFSVSNSQTVAFRILIEASSWSSDPMATLSYSSIASVINVSDSNTVLDTFTLDASLFNSGL